MGVWSDACDRFASTVDAVISAETALKVINVSVPAVSLLQAPLIAVQRRPSNPD